tara:strand:+ start:1627 stop:2073 length:447 start_codon:yes stop_codon:yes gene_type:complete
VETAFISLGSNLDHPIKHILDAFSQIEESDKIIVSKISSLYKTIPVGPQNQNDYINAVIIIQTSLTPINLLSTLQGIEKKHKRKRSIKWGPRSLDLDILMFGRLILKTRNLTIPHPELVNREFVLIPLLEVTNQDFTITKYGKISRYI